MMTNGWKDRGRVVPEDVVYNRLGPRFLLQGIPENPGIVSWFLESSAATLGFVRVWKMPTA